MREERVKQWPAPNTEWSQWWGVIDATGELLCVRPTRTQARAARKPRSGERVILVTVKWVGVE